MLGSVALYVLNIVHPIWHNRIANHQAGVCKLVMKTGFTEFGKKSAVLNDGEFITHGGQPGVDHFDNCAEERTLSEINLNGHDDPTMIQKLEELTGIDAKTIQLDDAKTLAMLISADTLGVPEFESEHVRDMIKMACPKTFDDFVKIIGLSRGADVWNGNAENLIKSGTATISEVIALRDEIMTYLTGIGICNATAYEIMESVRRGRGLSAEHERIMTESGAPEWYVESCKKITYLFPKAPAVAYTVASFRIAWFKAHYPEAFSRAQNA